MLLYEEPCPFQRTFSDDKLECLVRHLDLVPLTKYSRNEDFRKELFIKSNYNTGLGTQRNLIFWVMRYGDDQWRRFGFDRSDRIMYLEKLAGSVCYYEDASMSLVHEAIKNGITLDSELLELLKTLGCTGDMVDIFRHNYLHSYAYRELPTRQIGTFTKLYRIFKCNPNQHAGCGGESVLQLLVKNKYWKRYEEIDELVNIGVDPNILDDENRTVFHHLLCNDNDDMINQQTFNKLLQIGCKPTKEDIRRFEKINISLLEKPKVVLPRGVECVDDVLKGVSTNSITLQFTTKGPNSLRVKLNELDLVKDEYTVKNRLMILFNKQEYYIESGDGIPNLFLNGEYQKEWTLKKICEFVEQINLFETQDEREAFMIYVSTVGPRWDIEQFEDIVFKGVVNSPEDASRFGLGSDIPEPAHKFVDWKNLWETTANLNKLRLVKLSSDRYVIMSRDY